MLLIVLALWYFGFISFHSRDTGKNLDRLTDVRAELVKAQRQLSAISVALQRLKADADSLGGQRALLEQQVIRLEAARDSIASSLRAASSAVTPPSESWLQKAGRFLFSGVPGNIVAAALLSVLALLYRKLWVRRKELGNTSSANPEEQ